MAERLTSKEIFARARAVMPGGVNSPVRSFKSVGGEPFFVKTAFGAKLVDQDGKTYVDYVMSYGPLLFGHGFDAVTRVVQETAVHGLSYGAPHQGEVELAERVCRMVPSIEKVRFVSSGTEALMAAVRLARAATGRDAILKLEGCYHGHADSFLVKAGSGVATLGIPGSPGVPAALAGLTLTAPYNDLAAAESLVAKAPVAAIVVEPIAANMGVVAPVPGYLEGLRALATKTGAILVFDEVITGFRVAAGGAQELLGVKPDLTCLGKIAGGGLPVGAYGGREDLMGMIAPDGPVYQAGTLSGNPLAMAAGIAMLDAIAAAGPSLYRKLDETGARLEAGLREATERAGATGRTCLNRVGSMLTCFFCPGPVRSWTDAAKADTAAHARYFHRMLEAGVFLAPAQFEAMFLSTAHGEAEVTATIQAHERALSERTGS